MRREYILIALGLLACTVLVRLVPHLPNATPITALALVSGVYLGRRWAMVSPLIALFLSDLIIGFYDWRIMASVYGSFVLIGALSWLVRKYPGMHATVAVTVSAPIVFFLITNFAVWLFSPWYAKDIAGLLYSYELGLPFLRTMLVGDLVYVPLFFGVFEALKAFFRNKTVVCYN